MFLHIDAVTHRCCYTQILLHSAAFSQRNFYTEKILHRDALTRGNFHTQKLLHNSARAGAFTHRCFRTEKISHTHTHALCREVSRREAFKRLTFFNGDELHITEVFTQKLLHTDALTLRKFLHREIYTHKRLYTEKFLQTELHRET